MKGGRMGGLLGQEDRQSAIDLLSSRSHEEERRRHEYREIYEAENAYRRSRVMLTHVFPPPPIPAPLTERRHAEHKRMNKIELAEEAVLQRKKETATAERFWHASVYCAFI
mmetsp:Transcript_8004/g.15625  ORF Transcript_8004/g.15625 Transcript_8004/m.15625 type:complete len:111 (-) Transcript_8004:979-1311(-)